MKRNSGIAFPWLGSLTVSGILVFNANPVLAQVTPDNTLGAESSVVNSRDTSSESIDGGAVRGQNLFHSFEEFNVGEDRGVYFTNPDAVTNIFSRVTGNDVSNILGTLGVDGAANLFLINPNGIVFGEGASLDVQGSFTATTADGIEFDEQGFFSAVNPQDSVLTISVPLGLQFGSSPGRIINRSFVLDNTGDNVGLQVPAGENLTLVGGDVSFEAGEATARGGNIEIGGLSAAGTVGFNDDGSLNFPKNVAKADISLSNAAEIDTRGTGGGDININARNLKLEAGKFGSSEISAGVIADSIGTQAQPGNITLDATQNITVNESEIDNQVEAEAVGDAGNVFINTSSLSLINGGRVSVNTLGQGDTGEVNITATEDIIFDGEDSNGNFSGLINVVGPNAEGDTEGIDIFTTNLTLTNGGRISASSVGQGNVGRVNITATEDIIFNGENSDGDFSGILNIISTDKPQSSEGVNISTTNLTLTNGGRIDAGTLGQGDAGAIEITATGDLTFDGDNSDKLPTGVFSQVEPGAVGKAGGIKISTDNLSLTNGGGISATTLGRGNAGAIEITATGDLTFDGESSNSNSGVFSQINPGAIGKAGGIKIFTNNLTLRNGGRVESSTLGRGNAGQVNITAKEDLTFDGQDFDGFNSGVLSQVGQGAVGNGGVVTISTTNLTLTNGGGIDASTLGEGNAGITNITAKENIIIDGEDLDGFTSGINSQSNPVAKGDAGGVIISTNNLTLTNGGQIDASIGGQGNGGEVNITATGDIVFDGQDSDGLRSGATSIVVVGAVGDAGGVVISTNNLTLTSGGRVSTSTLGQGNGGKLAINANSLKLDNNAVISSQSESTFEAGDIILNIANSLQAKDSEISTSSSQSSGGNLTITAGDIQLRGDSDITTNIFFGEGSGGNIAIEADSIIAFDDSDIFAFAADGQGGNITLDTPAYFGENFTLNSLTSNPDTLQNNSRADINATGAVSGSVTIPDVSSIQNSLTELPNNSLNTDELVANSCVAPVGDRGEGKFIITGTESLPVRPGDGIPSKFPTGEVRSVPEKQSRWQPGEPIVEPQGAYRLANGKLVLSRECSQ